VKTWNAALEVRPPAVPAETSACIPNASPTGRVNVPATRPAKLDGTLSAPASNSIFPFGAETAGPAASAGASVSNRQKIANPGANAPIQIRSRMESPLERR